MRFNMTVSCEMAALNLFLHCFLEIVQGYLDLLGFLGQKLDFLRNCFMGNSRGSRPTACCGRFGRDGEER